MNRPKQICTRCIYDSMIGGIMFDEQGVCNFCHQIDKLKQLYHTGKPQGQAQLEKIVEEIKKNGRGKRYDCAIGVSGGTDSSYLLMKAVDWGLRPLAIHYDNTWNTAIATQNIKKVTSKFSIDLYTHVVNNKEIDDIYRAFLLAGVPEFDASTDMALVQVLRKVAAQYKINYILEGHSFVAEGISPLSGTYIDGGYVKDVHKKFGSRSVPSYPALSFSQFMKWTCLYQQKFIRPFWYIDYSKQAAREALTQRTGWVCYGGHHLENRASAFSHTIYRIKKFNHDLRNLSLAANVRNGLMSREEALVCYNTPVVPDPHLESYVMKRTALSSAEYGRLVSSDSLKRSFRDFKNYKKRFELLRPFFYLLAKKGRIPMSFYLKYCFPLKSTL